MRQGTTKLYEEAPIPSLPLAMLGAGTGGPETLRPSA
jgi:hypothetical protein